MLIMVRPIKPRFVRALPWITYFKPRGFPLLNLDEVVLRVEELEAIKLKDLEGLDQERCAKKMKISRGTFQRILNSARRKIADALVNGKAIRIEGGNYRMPIARGRGFGRGRRFGQPNVCICPSCGNQQVKVAGVPCARVRCEKCGSLMVRGE